MSILELTLHVQKETPYGDVLGEIHIGEYVERFGVSTTYWTLGHYERQWRSSLSMLATASQGCFITSITDPATAGARLAWWLFYRESTELIFQNQLLILDASVPFQLSDPTGWIPARRTRTDDGQPISEWRIPTADLEARVTVISSVAQLVREQEKAARVYVAAGIPPPFHSGFCGHCVPVGLKATAFLDRGEKIEDVTARRV